MYRSIYIKKKRISMHHVFSLGRTPYTVYKCPHTSTWLCYEHEIRLTTGCTISTYNLCCDGTRKANKPRAKNGHRYDRISSPLFTGGIYRRLLPACSGSMWSRGAHPPIPPPGAGADTSMQPPQSAETLPYHLVGSRLSHGEMKLCPTPLTRVLALDRVVAEQWPARGPGVSLHD
jgi:hypothetical protein